jgi:hypothetical protein
VKGLYLSRDYEGVALTLVDSLSTLAVIGDSRRFQESVNWVTNHVRESPSEQALYFTGCRSCKARILLCSIFRYIHGEQSCN